MKKSTGIIVSIATGILPCWWLGFLSADSLNNMTSTTKMIGNRRMLFSMHPILQLAVATLITSILLYGWYRLTRKLWPSIYYGFKSIKISSPSDSFIKDFFQIGQWRAKSLVKIIFYFGIVLSGLQLLNVSNIFFLQGIGEVFMYEDHIPMGLVFMGLIFVLLALVALILWKCFCEILYIVLRAFETYYFKAIEGTKEGEEKGLKKSKNDTTKDKQNMETANSNQ